MRLRAELRPAPVPYHRAVPGDGVIAVVACGAAKATTPQRAQLLYIGQHFRLSMEAARSLHPDVRVFILSAKYGLVRPSQIIAPYNVTLSGPRAVTAGQVREQARELGLEDETVVALAGRAYADLLAQVFPVVHRPLAGLPIGKQRQGLSRMAREGWVR